MALAGGGWHQRLQPLCWRRCESSSCIAAGARAWRRSAACGIAAYLAAGVTRHGAGNRLLAARLVTALA